MRLSIFTIPENHGAGSESRGRSPSWVLGSSYYPTCLADGIERLRNIVFWCWGRRQSYPALETLWLWRWLPILWWGTHNWLAYNRLSSWHKHVSNTLAVYTASPHSFHLQASEPSQVHRTWPNYAPGIPRLQGSKLSCQVSSASPLWKIQWKRLVITLQPLSFHSRRLLVPKGNG